MTLYEVYFLADTMLISRITSIRNGSRDGGIGTEALQYPLRSPSHQATGYSQVPAYYEETGQKYIQPACTITLVLTITHSPFTSAGLCTSSSHTKNNTRVSSSVRRPPIRPSPRPPPCKSSCKQWANLDAEQGFVDEVEAQG